MHRLFALLACCGWSLLANAGLFGPDFEITKTVPPKNGEDSVLYMTNNGFTADEKYYVFGRRFEPRSAGNTKNGALGSRHHLMRRNLETGEEVEIAYHPNISFLGGVVSGNTLFYNTLGKEPALYTVDIPSASEPTLIWKLPKNERYGKWTVYPVSAALNGTRVLLALTDSPPRPTSTKLNDWHSDLMRSDAHGYLYLGVQKDGEWTFSLVYEQTSFAQGFIGHAQLNPVTGEDALIELDGIKRLNRAFILNFKTQEMKAVRSEEEGQGVMSHCNYVGDQLVQYMLYKGGSTDIGLADVKQGAFKEWAAGNHHHFAAHIASDGSFYTFGDGYAAHYSSTVRYTVRNGKMVDSTTISSRGPNTAWEEYHGHPRFSPSGKWLVYTTSDRMEHGQVVIVKDPLKEK